MEVLTNVKDILQMARDERCSGYTAELLVKDLNELIALREAGEKMAEMLKPFAYAFNKVDGDPFHKKGEGMTVPYSVVDLSLKTKMIDWKNISAALEAWESANK